MIVTIKKILCRKTRYKIFFVFAICTISISTYSQNIFIKRSIENIRLDNITSNIAETVKNYFYIKNNIIEHNATDNNIINPKNSQESYFIKKLKLWKSPYVYIINFIILCGLLYLLIQQKRLRQKYKDKLAEEKARLCSNISHDLKNPITVISHTIDEISNANSFTKDVRIAINLIKTKTLNINESLEHLDNNSKKEKKGLPKTPTLEKKDKEFEKPVPNCIGTQKQGIENFEKDLKSKKKKLSDSKKDQKFLNQVTELIEKNYKTPNYTIDDMINKLGYSRSVFFTKMKSVSGHAPKEFVRIIKMKKAAELLRNKNASISDVSFNIGYKDPAYFSKSFKNFYGETPSSYLNKFK